ncbi:MAG: hypothetical protein C4B57_02930 [Deltaproteobacteria bacterium]|nr:MAG: hypothetical protein C4B57_02930 [Deltaproteobacteria bacterium]
METVFQQLSSSRFGSRLSLSTKTKCARERIFKDPMTTAAAIDRLTGYRLEQSQKGRNFNEKNRKIDKRKREL